MDNYLFHQLYQVSDTYIFFNIYVVALIPSIIIILLVEWADKPGRE